MALAFSAGSAQAGAMRAPLRPRPTRALRCNFRRFESASTKKDRESRAIELRTPPSMNRQARPQKRSETGPRQSNANALRSHSGKDPRRRGNPTNQRGSMGEGRLPQTAAKRPMTEPQKPNGRTAITRGKDSASATRPPSWPANRSPIAQSVTQPDHRPSPPHTARARANPRPHDFKLPP